MFVWAPIPEPYRHLNSLELSKLLLAQANVAASPGIGFGRSVDGCVRSALVGIDARIRQAVRGTGRVMDAATEVGMDTGRLWRTETTEFEGSTDSP